MKLLEIGTDPLGLRACAALLNAAFPAASHHTPEYLQWLYCDNPAGQVIGYNAWEGDQIIGHYACIPAELRLEGKPCRGLLALHTAIHPDYRNAGTVFTLANKTFKLAAERGFACVYAVANAASTPIFVQAAGFQLVSQLTAALGLAKLRPDWASALAANRFRRRWTAASAAWRAQNPANRSSLRAGDSGTLIFRARTNHFPIVAYGLMPVEGPLPADHGAIGPGIHLFLGLLPAHSCRYRGYLHLPERLKPSPLNFIYKPLSGEAPSTLERNDIILGFHDFDPY